MVYGSETWAMKVNDMRRLERAQNTMLRWMCGVTLRDWNHRPGELMDCLGVVSQVFWGRGGEPWACGEPWAVCMGMWSVKIRVTGYRHAESYRLRRQSVRGELE